MADFKLKGKVELVGPGIESARKVANEIKQAFSGLKFEPIKIDFGDIGKLKGNTDAISTFSSALKDLSKSFSGLITSAAGADLRLKDFLNTVRTGNDNGINEARVQAQLLAKDLKLVSRSAAEGNISFDRLASGIARRGFQYFQFSVAAAFVSELKEAIGAAAEAVVGFDDTQKTLIQITGKSAEEVSGLTNEALRLGKALGSTTIGLLDASKKLAQAGFSLGEARKTLRVIAEAELGPTFGDIEDITEGLIALGNQFSLIGSKDPYKTFRIALSGISNVSKEFAVNASDIIEAVRSAGGVFAASEKDLARLRETALGTAEQFDASQESLRKFAAIVTTVVSTTKLSASVVGTGLRTITTRLQRLKTEADLKDIFGENFTLRDAEGQFIGVFEALQKIGEELKGQKSTSLAFAKTLEAIGGLRQAKVVIPILSNIERAQRALTLARENDNSVTLDAITAQQKVSIQIKKLSKEFIGLFAQLGQSKVFKEMLRDIIRLANGLIRLADSLKNLVPVLTTFIAAYTAKQGLGVIGRLAGIDSVFGIPLGRTAAGTSPSELIRIQQARIHQLRTDPFNKRGKKSRSISRIILETGSDPNLFDASNQGRQQRNTLSDLANGPVTLSDKQDIDNFLTKIGLAKAKGGIIPVSLMPGELVLSPKQAKKIGYETLDKINAGIVPGSGNTDSYDTLLRSGSYVINKRSTRRLGFADGGEVGDRKRFVVEDKAVKIQKGINLTVTEIEQITKELELTAGQTKWLLKTANKSVSRSIKLLSGFGIKVTNDYVPPIPGPATPPPVSSVPLDKNRGKLILGPQTSSSESLRTSQVANLPPGSVPVNIQRAGNGRAAIIDFAGNELPAELKDFVSFVSNLGLEVDEVRQILSKFKSSVQEGYVELAKHVDITGTGNKVIDAASAAHLRNANEILEQKSKQKEFRFSDLENNINAGVFLERQQKQQAETIKRQRIFAAKRRLITDRKNIVTASGGAITRQDFKEFDSLLAQTVEAAKNAQQMGHRFGQTSDEYFEASKAAKKLAQKTVRLAEQLDGAALRYGVKRGGPRHKTIAKRIDQGLITPLIDSNGNITREASAQEILDTIITGHKKLPGGKKEPIFGFRDIVPPSSELSTISSSLPDSFIGPPRPPKAPPRVFSPADDPFDDVFIDQIIAEMRRKPEKPLTSTDVARLLSSNASVDSQKFSISKGLNKDDIRKAIEYGDSQKNFFDRIGLGKYLGRDRIPQGAKRELSETEKFLNRQIKDERARLRGIRNQHLSTRAGVALGGLAYLDSRLEPGSKAKAATSIGVQALGGFATGTALGGPVLGAVLGLGLAAQAAGDQLRQLEVRSLQEKLNELTNSIDSVLQDFSEVDADKRLETFDEILQLMRDRSRNEVEKNTVDNTGPLDSLLKFVGTHDSGVTGSIALGGAGGLGAVKSIVLGSSKYDKATLNSSFNQQLRERNELGGLIGSLFASDAQFREVRRSLRKQDVNTGINNIVKLTETKAVRSQLQKDLKEDENSVRARIAFTNDTTREIANELVGSDAFILSNTKKLIADRQRAAVKEIEPDLKTFGTDKFSLQFIAGQSLDVVKVLNRQIDEAYKNQDLNEASRLENERQDVFDSINTVDKLKQAVRAQEKDKILTEVREKKKSGKNTAQALRETLQPQATDLAIKTIREFAKEYRASAKEIKKSQQFTKVDEAAISLANNLFKLSIVSSQTSAALESLSGSTSVGSLNFTRSAFFDNIAGKDIRAIRFAAGNDPGGFGLQLANLENARRKLNQGALAQDVDTQLDLVEKSFRGTGPIGDEIKRELRDVLLSVKDGESSIEEAFKRGNIDKVFNEGLGKLTSVLKQQAELTEKSLTSLVESINKTTSILVKTRLSKAKDLGRFNIGKDLDQIFGVTNRSTTIDQQIRAITGVKGAITPQALGDLRAELVGKKNALLDASNTPEKLKNNSFALSKFDARIQLVTRALEVLRTSTEKYKVELDKVAEKEKKRTAVKGVLTDFFTATPEQLKKQQEALSLVQNINSGQIGGFNIRQLKPEQIQSVVDQLPQLKQLNPEAAKKFEARLSDIFARRAAFEALPPEEQRKILEQAQGSSEAGIEKRAIQLAGGQDEFDKLKKGDRKAILEKAERELQNERFGILLQRKLDAGGGILKDALGGDINLNDATAKGGAAARAAAKANLGKVIGVNAAAGQQLDKIEQDRFNVLKNGMNAIVKNHKEALEALAGGEQLVAGADKINEAVDLFSQKVDALVSAGISVDDINVNVNIDNIASIEQIVDKSIRDNVLPHIQMLIENSINGLGF